MVRGSQSKPCSPKTIHLCSPSPHTRYIIHNRFTRPYICTLYRDAFRCERGHFWNIQRACLSTAISHAYLTGASIYCCFLRQGADAGAQSTYWMKKNSLFHHNWVCVCTEILLVKGNKCVALYRKKELVMVMESCAHVWLREGVCVLPGCMVESKHIPILRFRHALKSLKLSCSLGSNCGLNSSYFPHTDALREKEREKDFKFHLQIASKVRLCISLM